MSSWRDLTFICAGGGGAVVLAATAVFLLWNGHQARPLPDGDGGLVVTSCGISTAPETDGFVVTFDARNDAAKDITLAKGSRIMGRAADTGALYLVTEGELRDTYLIRRGQDAKVRMYLHMQCADEPDWRKCFQQVYGNVEAFEIVDTVVDLPRPKL